MKKTSDINDPAFDWSYYSLYNSQLERASCYSTVLMLLCEHQFENPDPDLAALVKMARRQLNKFERNVREWEGPKGTLLKRHRHVLLKMMSEYADRGEKIWDDLAKL